MRTWLLIILLAMLGRSAEAGVPQYIPIFQFGVFYNLDLEMNPGASMTINGRVHSNYNIYATGSGSGSPLIFSTNVEAVQYVYLTQSPLDPSNFGIRSGNVIFSITNNNPQTNVVPLFSPVPDTNTLTKILTIPPSGTDPTTSAGQVYLFNQADIIVSNSVTTNLSVFYRNVNMVPTQLLVPPDVTNIYISGQIFVTNPITHAVTTQSSYSTNTYYSFVTNANFYDYRETKAVAAVQFDVTKFGNWLTNAVNGGTHYTTLNTTGGTSKGHGVNIVYLYNSITNNSSQLPAIRVVNGSRLPAAGLTVATPFPLYVRGDYNTTTNGVNFSTTLGDTTNTYPAALMGDAISALSANWSDAYYAATSLSSRNPTTTSINAAILDGIVPSDGLHYSGGFENSLRLLENWGGVTLTYNGSIVALFPSQIATNPWPGTASVYNPPTRRWGFDSSFLNPAKLPPGTPMVVSPYLISTNSLLEGSAAGSDSVILTATIPWTATRNASWLHLSAANQSGPGSIVGFTNVVFTFDANPSTSWRTGTLTIASQTITVTQMGIPSYYNLAITNLLEGSSASGDSVILTANGAWTATANDSWLHLSAANQSGTGNATVIFTFDANLGATRTGTLTIAGQTLTVTQAGANYVTADPLIPLITGLMGPRGVALDGGGNLYIAETGTNNYKTVGKSSILKWTVNNGKLTTLVTSNAVIPLYAADGIALDEAGNIYFSDPRLNKLFRWTAAISNTTALVSSGIFDPVGVAVDGAGDVYVASEVVQVNKYSWVGGTSNVTTLISSGLNNPYGLALDVAGNVYVADSGNKAVKKWTAVGSNVTTLVSSGLSAPASVAVDGSGNVYISDALNKAIYKWKAANSNVVTLVPSGLSVPYGVAVDGVGNVYITDFSNNVVDKMVYSFVDPTAKTETFSAGNDVLPVVLPATVNLAGALAPVSDETWLTITGITNGVVSFAFSVNTGSSSRTANITLLGQTIPVTQAAVIPPILTGFTILGNGAFRFAFTNNQGASFTIWSTTNLALPMSNWTELGSITNDGSGQYQFSDLTATNGAQCFYRVSSP